MYFEAFLAGVWASIGSTLGKLTGIPSVVGEGYLIWAGLLVTMVVANTWGCRHYLRSLDAATNSVAPTVISAASSYVLSVLIGMIFMPVHMHQTLLRLDALPTYLVKGIIGIAVFDEGASVRWWAGALCILLGLALVARPRTKCKQTE